MFQNYIAIFIVLFVVIGMFVLLVKLRRPKETAALTILPLVEGASFEAIESTPPFSDGVRVVARSTATPREQRQEEIHQRQDTGLCLYCDKRAAFSIPLLKQIRPVLDPVYRYLNVVPVHRWKIEITPTSESVAELCEVHHAIARSHLERRIAENQVDYAGFVERQRHEMYEFEVYALDERMLDDANTVKRGKKQKKMAEVRNLKLANGTGN